MAQQQVVILGGGTGGTMVANRLRHACDTEAMAIHVVDSNNTHVYQPGLLFVPFGLTTLDDIARPRARQLHSGITFHEAGIDHVDLDANTVHLDGGDTLRYDVLVIASGARLLPEETEGLTGPGWGTTAGTFFSPEGAQQLHTMLDTFTGGQLVINVVDMPIKCPVAPLEFAFLADWFLHERGIRSKTDIIFATPLDAAFTKPVAASHLASLLHDKNIELVTEFNAGEVDGASGVLESYDGRTLDFDVLVSIPAHGGSAYVDRSEGLGDALGFVPTDKHTLQSLTHDNVFAIGDASNIPTSKAGSVTHFSSEILVENVQSYLADRELVARFDGHANCFVETGFHRALLIDFNYETEPLPGHYPARVGLPLLRESRINHWGKLMFQWAYWHTLLPGRDIPGITPAMPTSGKQRPTEGQETRTR